jgi:hypothetical protein
VEHLGASSVEWASTNVDFLPDLAPLQNGAIFLGACSFLTLVFGAGFPGAGFPGAGVVDIAQSMQNVGFRSGRRVDWSE